MFGLNIAWRTALSCAEAILSQRDDFKKVSNAAVGILVNSPPIVGIFSQSEKGV